VSSVSAGPGTRANIDEFTKTTSKGVETIGGAERGKAIIFLNPAEPPMRSTLRGSPVRQALHHPAVLLHEPGAAR
jgi:acetaldehyde dehydrogenase (acetylating)